MKKGKFLVKNVSELDVMYEDVNSINGICDLLYLDLDEKEKMKRPIKTFLEYFNFGYLFYETGIYSKSNEEMFIYAGRELIDRIGSLEFYNGLVKRNIEGENTIKLYINSYPEECLYDFWWDDENDYFIVFGDEKMDIIDYFIRKQYNKCNNLVKKKNS